MVGELVRIYPDACKHEDRDGFLVRLLKRAYEPSLRAAIRYRAWVLGTAGAANLCHCRRLPHMVRCARARAD